MADAPKSKNDPDNSADDMANTMNNNNEDPTLSNGANKTTISHQWVHQVTQTGIKQEDILDGYSKWVTHSDYDSDLAAVGYTAPDLTVKRCTESFPEERRSEVRILDVGAGTGMVARGLRERGFQYIDALDPSEAMLGVAKKNNLYENYICEFLNEKQLPIASDTYDGVTGAGCFVEGHIPCVALYELIRVVKPGGLILICTRLEYLETVSEYKDRLEPLMDKLEQEGKWKKVARIIEPNYYQEKEGITWKYEVL